MELTLNLVWVFVAIVGILAQCVVISRGSTASERQTSIFRKIIAMVCALVILFFVISMTDDLHDQAILFEEKKPSRLLSETANPAPSSATQAGPCLFLLFISCASLIVALPAVRRPVDVQQVVIAASFLPRPVDGRAPPLSLA